MSVRSAQARSVRADTVAVVAVGGAAGALLRHGVGVAWPQHGSVWPAVLVNVVGCLAMGVLVAVVDERRVGHRLLRPFLATGVLGGFTTFSAYTVGVLHLIAAGRNVAAVAHLLITMAGALVAVLAGVRGGRLLARNAGAR